MIPVAAIPIVHVKIARVKTAPADNNNNNNLIAYFCNA